MVTPYTGPRQQPPAPKKGWPFATAFLLMVAALLFSGGVAWVWAHREPTPVQTVVVTVTVLQTQPAPTPRTIVVYEPATVFVDRIVTATNSPPFSPPSTATATATATRAVVAPKTGRP